MPTVLILANETIAGKALLDRIREPREQGSRFFVVVPQTRPRHGNVIYDEVVRDSAQVRVDLAVEFIRDLGAAGDGEVGDQDPFNAAMDAVRHQPIDEIIVSTLPSTSSGWLRRDLIERLEEATELPVEHVVVDLAGEGLPFDVTLVVANLTVAAPELVERLKALADEGPRRFIAVVPQSGVQGHRVREARQRLRRLLASLDDAGIVAAGMIGDPDPYTAVMNAVQYFHISEIVISTLPEGSSQWVADKLVDRVRDADQRRRSSTSSRAREGGGVGGRAQRAHVDDDHDHHGPPEANRSLAGRARVPRDAAFHHLRGDDLRRVLHGLLLHPGRGRRRVAGRGRPPAEADRGLQHRDPDLVLVHDPLRAGVDPQGQPARPATRHGGDVPARPDVPVRPDQRVRPRRLLAAGLARRARSSTGSPACTART